jgi:hypothetical protein
MSGSGRMEGWNIGIMDSGLGFFPILPIFHYSILPVLSLVFLLGHLRQFELLDLS